MGLHLKNGLMGVHDMPEGMSRMKTELLHEFYGKCNRYLGMVLKTFLTRNHVRIQDLIQHDYEIWTLQFGDRGDESHM